MVFFLNGLRKKRNAVKSHLLEAQLPGYESKDGLVVTENKSFMLLWRPKQDIVETRIKEHFVENVDGSLGYSFERQRTLVLIIILRVVLENPDPSYKVVDFGPGFVDLRDELRSFKRTIFLERDYEILF